MTLSESLTLFSPIITVTANVAVLYYVVPAFKRTRNRAFLWLGCAALLGTFDTLLDCTVGVDLHRKSRSEYETFRILRRCTYFGDCAFSATGIILLAQAAVARIPSEDSTSDPRNV